MPVRACRRAQGAEIEAADRACRGVEKVLKVGVLARLHQAEVARGPLQPRRAVQGAEDREAGIATGLAQQPLVARAGDIVKDHAGDADRGMEAGEAAGQGGDRGATSTTGQPVSAASCAVEPAARP